MLGISRVVECTLPECVYNRNSRCYAIAVTIGNGVAPDCLTFHTANNRVAKREEHAGVGACKVPECLHNRDYACGIQRIYVGYHANRIACLAFRKE